jgi:DNA-binding transcriptional LysR family regulator
MLQVVERCGTVTGAAQVLHYTPSAVSHQLRTLATELGVELVEQHGRGIRLTPAARTLLEHTGRLHAQAELARAEIAALDGEPAGRFTMCAFSTAATSLLPSTAARLRDTYRRLTVRLIEAEPSRCFDLLLAHDADLALVVVTAENPPLSDERFRQYTLLDDPLDLVVPAGHSLAERKAVTLADAARQPWIVGRPDGTYYQLVLTACMSAGFTPSIAHYADEWDTGTALVANGFGVMLVPRLALLHSDAVVRIPLRGEPAPARRILAAVRNGAEGHPAVAKALELLESTARLTHR